MAGAFDEVQLLWSSFSTPAPPGPGEGAHTDPHAPQALNEQATLLKAAGDADQGASAYFEQLRGRVASLLRQRARPAAVEVLSAGVTCLEGFLQANLCGPIPEWKTRPLWEAAEAAAEAEQPPGREDRSTPDEQWVVRQLEADGEEMVGRVQALDLLLAALVCLAEPLGHTTTGGQGPKQPQPQQQPQQQPAAELLAWLREQRLGGWCWWAMRAVMQQQHVLHGRSNTLQLCLKQLSAEAQGWAASLRQQAEGAAAAEQRRAEALAAAAHLEAAAVHRRYGQVAEAQAKLDAAAAALGVRVEVTGALGYRTKHQVDPKAQLVASVHVGAAGASAPPGGPEAGPEAGPGGSPDGLDVAALGFDEVGLAKELEGMEDESAVFIAPHLAEPAAADGGDAAAAAAAAVDGEGAAAGPAAAGGGGGGAWQRTPCMLQALLLGWAAQIRRGTSRDELQQWQMAPFVEAVLQQQRTQYMLHATARLLKSRHERERGRTRERSLMQLEQLCNALRAAQPAAAVRRPYAHAVHFPLWPLLQKELAELYIAMGFVGAALRIFERLDMWDALILCYRLLDKKQVAKDLVVQRLQALPDDAKLWCVLGDIEQQDQHYCKAWEVSGGRSSRAQRSLGRSAMSRKDYGAAAAAYGLALGLNPLYPDAWFSLGYCRLQLGDIPGALQAFSQVTHLEPDNGEAWANLAALWLKQGGWREALHASEQAVKYKRESWQTWDNYATAAAKAGAWPACARALAQVFELTQGQRLPLEMLEHIVAELEREAARLKQPAAAEAVGGEQEAQQQQQQQQQQPSLPPQQLQQGGADEDEEELMEAPEQLLRLLAVSDGLPEDAAGREARAVHAAKAAAAAATARHRSHEAVAASVGSLLKAAANSPACGAGVWGLLGRWYSLRGEALSSQEAWLKQVRALQSSAYRSDERCFAAMADASERLCRAQMAAAASGQGGARELASARMHLRGLLKQCEQAFEVHGKYAELQALLEEVLAAEAATAPPTAATRGRE